MTTMRKLPVQGVHHIAPIHVADAIEQLVTGSRESLSEDRAPKDPYTTRPREVDDRPGD
jgi:hypothetical protein